MSTVLKWLGIILVVLAVALVALFAVLNTAWFKDYVTSRVSTQIGRTVTIEGDLDIDLFWRPRVTAEQVRLENAPWSEEPYMVEIRRLELQVDLLELLRGRLVFARIALIEPEILLQVSEQGEPNWGFIEERTPEEEELGELPTIRRFIIEEGRLSYQDPTSNTAITASISEIPTVARAVSGRPLQAQGEGQFYGEPLQFTVSAGSLLNLEETDQSYPLQAEFTVSDWQTQLEGTIAQPLELKGVDLAVAAEGSLPETLLSALGMAVLDLLPHQLQVQVTRKDAVWAVQELKGVLGDDPVAGNIIIDTASTPLAVHGSLSWGESDLAGEIAVDTQGERPFLRADLSSQRLAVSKLTSIFDIAPDEPPAPILQTEIDPELLRTVDAVLDFQGQQVLVAGQTLSDVSTKIELKDGHLLTTEPLSFAVAGGSVRSTVELEGREQSLQAAITTEASRIDLNKALADAEITDAIDGIIGGQADLSGRGTTPAQFLGSANGEVSLILADGQVDQLLVELLKLDVLRALAVVIDEEDPTVAIRCGVADFTVQDGIMETKVLVIDTADTQISGEGTIDLQAQTLDLVLNAEPKEPGLVASVSPVHISGPMTDPSISIDASELVTQVGAAAALGALATPLAALIPFIDPGDEEPTDCQALIDAAQD